MRQPRYRHAGARPYREGHGSAGTAHALLYTFTPCVQANSRLGAGWEFSVSVHRATWAGNGDAAVALSSCACKSPFSCAVRPYESPHPRSLMFSIRLPTQRVEQNENAERKQTTSVGHKVCTSRSGFKSQRNEQWQAAGRAGRGDSAAGT